MKMVKKQTRIFFMMAIVGAITLFGPQVTVKADPGDDEGSGSCSAQTDCYKTTWNSTTNKWEEKKVGSVSCTGAKDCVSGDEYVECEGARSSCAV